MQTLTQRTLISHVYIKIEREWTAGSNISQCWQCYEVSCVHVTSFQLDIKLLSF